MKKIFMFSAFVAVLYSCNTNTSKKNIVARNWAYHEIDMDGQIMSAKQLGNPVISFKEDGFYELSYGPMSDSGKWEMKSDTAFYTVSAISKKSQDLIILKLTKDTFRLKYPLANNMVVLTMTPSKENF